MKVQVISKWHNEIELAAFFLNYYSWADKITIYLDEHTNDSSDDIIRSFPNTEIAWGKSDGKLNDYECAEGLNKLAYESKADWVICVDADEFIFPVNFADPRETLLNADGNLIYAHMWNMYEHITDEPLNLNNYTILQRRHGDPCRIPECVKPCILKPSLQIHWGVGCHAFHPNPRLIPSSVRFDGAHWQSVDLELACKRRIKGVKERLSQTNIDNLWASHNFNVTREEIVALMEAHKNDPQLF